MLSSHRLFSAVKEIDPTGVALRTSALHRQRGTYEVPGPNWVWSMDGYCKLEFVGIQIYGAIDAYSRKVLWVYVGVSGRSSVSVCRQYLDFLEETGIRPKVLRTDKGGETLQAAAAHYELAANDARINNQEDFTFEDCYLFGTSVANQRIERWWGELSTYRLFQWRVSSL
jgi:hypothetical protein